MTTPTPTTLPSPVVAVHLYPMPDDGVTETGQETALVNERRYYAGHMESTVNGFGVPVLSWDQGDQVTGIELPGPLVASGDGESWTSEGPLGHVVVRPPDPYDAVQLEPRAGVPQPRAVVAADIIRGGGILATELDAVVAGDNTVATLLLDTGAGTYVRYGGDWQLLSPDSTSLDDMLLVQVGPGAVDVWDQGESSRSTVQVSDLPISVPGQDDVMPLPEPVDTGSTGEGGLLLASGVMIPPIETVDDLDLGMRFASIHPSARWYVAKRAEALGAGAKVPGDWKSSGVVRPFPTRVEQLDADVSTPKGVLAAARRFSALCAAGAEPEAPAYTQLMQAAYRLELWDEPDVLTAARWQDWLHPRGIDGRFIEVGSYVDVFGKPSGEKALRNAKADRRRAKITGLFPEGANVTYFDTKGNPIPAAPAKGYPSTIPQNQIKKRISSAPNSRARLTSVSSREEFQAGLHEAMTQEQYDQAVQEFNDQVVTGLHPERSAAKRGVGPVTDEEYGQHADFIKEVTNAGLAKQADGGSGLGADAALKDSYGRWGQDHLERMLVMTDQIYQQVTAGKPKDHKALFLGGLPGSGKSTLLDSMGEGGKFNKDEWVTINPDLMKNELIRAGWYPHIEGLTPNETAGFIHQQSSEMAYMMERMAMKDGYNLVFDVTMGGRANWLDKALDQLAAYQYNPPDGIFIDSDLEHSLASSAHRHHVGLDKYRTGTSADRRPGVEDIETFAGGRYVPPEVVKAQMGDAGGSTNMKNFDRLKAKFARWAMYDVASAPGEKPVLELKKGQSTPEMPGTGEAAAAA